MTEFQKHILCIEDNRDTAALLAEDLGERGYAVTLAHDGQQGFDVMQEHCPDLVICDINMPVMSGFELLDKLNAASPRFQDVPFIFLTALKDRDTELKGRLQGADDYVVKPIDFDLLATIIQARLARVARKEVWRATVDLNSREIDSLTWSARGKTSDEIAQILGLTKRNVDFHLDSARTKLNVATRTQAVVKAVTGGLIVP
ncbi:MAG: response regulator [Burkholderiaceae bacterium]|nr:response regulator [Burkholderiaceae bacterium]